MQLLTTAAAKFRYRSTQNFLRIRFGNLLACHDPLASIATMREDKSLKTVII
jgi:hypothetical protein